MKKTSKKSYSGMKKMSMGSMAKKGKMMKK